MANRRELTPEERADADRLSAAWLQYKQGNPGSTQEWLAAASGLGTQGAVGQYLRAVIPLNLEALLAICNVIKADPVKISPRLTENLAYAERIARNGKAQMFTVNEHTEDYGSSVGKIEYWSAKGSCGGGFLNYDQMPKGHLVKEITFFDKYDLKPSNAFAIYADGNSMADFIVDGDIVIFDKSKTEPQSGKIFAIDHPDGLRIKMLRRDIEGSWLLESTNPDKRAYPDERISPEHAELLKIHGRFVYRQGG